MRGTSCCFFLLQQRAGCVAFHTGGVGEGGGGLAGSGWFTSSATHRPVLSFTNAGVQPQISEELMLTQFRQTLLPKAPSVRMWRTPDS